jgi:S-adenosylmethionine synthetase
MTRSTYVFTSESVSEGHPDKVCDRISDAVLDAFLAEEPEARVACETFATTNRVVIGGEVGLSDKEKLSSYMGRIDEIARACIKDIGYEQDKFHHETVEVTNCCTNNRRISPKVWMPQITKTKAQAIRGSCLAMPPMKLKN